MSRKNKIVVIIILFVVVLSFLTVSYGFGISDLKGNQVEGTTLQKAGNGIVKVVTTVGVVISVIMLVVIGIKYMLGSTEEKATYKKSLMPYAIGAILVFAASEIAQLIYNLANEL